MSLDPLMREIALAEPATEEGVQERQGRQQQQAATTSIHNNGAQQQKQP
jgi:hypothetical protein